MSDTTWTTMHIGGSLPSDKIEEFLEAIKEEFSYEAQTRPDDEKEIREAVAKGESILLQAHVVGQPEEVICFCQQNNLTYWLHYDAGYEWDAGIEIWKPGADRVETCGASGQGYEPMISLQELRKLDSNTFVRETVAELARFEAERVPPLTIIEVAEAEETEEVKS